LTLTATSILAGLLAAALAGESVAAPAGPLFFRCEAQRREEHGARTSVQHVKLAGANSLLYFEHSPGSVALKDVKETEIDYEWCVVACGEYSQGARRFRAGPYVLNKRSGSLSQDLVELSPSGSVEERGPEGPLRSRGRDPVLREPGDR
jgi:hypothetical protein